MNLRARVGVVVIGRNEGERLVNCLKSLAGGPSQLVYVDSGSTDGSVNVARKLGAEVVDLDMSIPFTAARARNEGFACLKNLDPKVEFVQFVDGDCEVIATWLENASAFLLERIEVAAVCGRLRERYPDKTVYNKLCDHEWNTPIGEAKACGGIVLMRVAAFEKADGFRADLIAGEEPELCLRLRAAGWKIWRLDEEMALHDAAMTKFSQWWKRSMRAGYAFAEGAYLHGASPERHWVGESKRAWIWGLGVPAVALILGVINLKWGLLGLLIYPIQIIRLAMRNSSQGKLSWTVAAFQVLGKFPEMLGQVKFLQRLFVGKQGRLIEYK